MHVELDEVIEAEWTGWTRFSAQAPSRRMRLRQGHAKPGAGRRPITTRLNRAGRPVLSWARIVELSFASTAQATL